MHGEYRESRAGFTLVEIMVVLAIVALVSAIAIPGLAKLGAFSRDEFRRATQEVNSVLRAAQLYATTYHVNTAVVYSMDQYSVDEANAIDTTPTPPDESGPPLDEDAADPAFAVPNPIVDSLTTMPVRQIEAAAIMYQLPGTMGELSGRYVPIPGDRGEFTPLPPGMSILLQSPDPENIDNSNPSNPVYGSYYSEFDWSNYRSSAAINRVGGLGMRKITAALGLPVALNTTELGAYASNPANYSVENFAAHVFQSSGRLEVPRDGLRTVFPLPDWECGDCDTNPGDCNICSAERFSIYIAPAADRPLDERLVEPESGALTYTDSKGLLHSNLRYQEIQIFKSTGRIAIPQNF